MKKLLIPLALLIGILIVWERAFVPPQETIQERETLRVTREESVVIDVVKEVGPSVVTIGVENLPRRGARGELGPFGLFFDTPNQEQGNEGKYIGSGFVIAKEGLIVTNKHVVSERDLDYIAVDAKGNKFNVDRIYRDPLNDTAILHIKNPPQGVFKEVKLGDSQNLQVGQFVIAIGTALGEFRNTVTTGVISGLGRGIRAGSVYEGYVERLDNVIQTDAAINPGNSGGPLLNSKGEVIGVNTAIAASGQNIGFAIPINIVRDSLSNFNATGQFNRAFLGVSYVMLSREAAILNDLVEGAYVRDVAQRSAADEAGIRAGDIIVKIDREKVTEKSGGVAFLINKKRVGDSVTIMLFRDGKTFDIKATLKASEE